MKLLLFDIDGTLLRSDGLGRGALEAAMTAVCGRPVSMEGVRLSGRTDPSIVQDALRQGGFPPAEAEALLPDVFAAYVAQMQARVDEADVTVLPGVRGLLDRLVEHPGVQLALLTGNLEPTAFLKLRRAGLADYFAFGAFGSDHADRAALPAVAVRRAFHHTGRRFAGHDVVILGDTEHDVTCGRGIGAFSVAVCTGRYTRTDLEPHTPHLLLDDFRDPAALLTALALPAN